MEDAGVTDNLEKQFWMNPDINIVKEKGVFGYWCTQNITHIYMCIVFDEVGGNINQKGDVHVGRKLLIFKHDTMT